MADRSKDPNYRQCKSCNDYIRLTDFPKFRRVCKWCVRIDNQSYLTRRRRQKAAIERILRKVAN